MSLRGEAEAIGDEGRWKEGDAASGEGLNPPRGKASAEASAEAPLAALPKGLKGLARCRCPTPLLQLSTHLCHCEPPPRGEPLAAWLKAAKRSPNSQGEIASAANATSQ
jgi:hypothetical protein